MKRTLFALTTILFSLFLNACISVHSHRDRHGPPPPDRHHERSMPRR